MIGGLLLNGCSRGLAELLTPMLQRETGLPVLGWLPQLPDCAIASRHLGLLTPGEVQGLADKVDRLASQLEETVDLEGVLALARSAAPLPAEPSVIPPEPEGPVVAVARDRAFCFYYEDNLDLLRRNGLRLAEFSPLEDRALPAGSCGRGLSGAVGGAAQPERPHAPGRPGSHPGRDARPGGVRRLPLPPEQSGGPGGPGMAHGGRPGGGGDAQPGAAALRIPHPAPGGGQPLSDLRGGDRRA